MSRIGQRFRTQLAQLGLLWSVFALDWEGVGLCRTRAVLGFDRFDRSELGLAFCG